MSELLECKPFEGRSLTETTLHFEYVLDDVNHACKCITYDIYRQNDHIYIDHIHLNSYGCVCVCFCEGGVLEHIYMYAPLCLRCQD